MPFSFLWQHSLCNPQNYDAFNFLFHADVGLCTTACVTLHLSRHIIISWESPTDSAWMVILLHKQKSQPPRCSACEEWSLQVFSRMVKSMLVSCTISSLSHLLCIPAVFLVHGAARALLVPSANVNGVHPSSCGTAVSLS